MKNKTMICLAGILLFLSLNTVAQKTAPILPGAYQTAQYLPLLKNKRVGLFIGHELFINKKSKPDRIA